MYGEVVWSIIIFLLGIITYIITKKSLISNDRKISIDVVIGIFIFAFLLLAMISIALNTIISADKAIFGLDKYLLIETTNPSVWVSYFGSLVGAFIGGIVTLVIMYYNTQKIVASNNRQLELEYMPILSIIAGPIIDYRKTNYELKQMIDDIESLIIKDYFNDINNIYNQTQDILSVRIRCKNISKTIIINGNLLIKDIKTEENLADANIEMISRDQESNILIFFNREHFNKIKKSKNLMFFAHVKNQLDTFYLQEFPCKYSEEVVDGDLVQNFVIGSPVTAPYIYSDKL